MIAPPSLLGISRTSEAVITSRRNVCCCGGAGGSPVAASPAASPSAPAAMADGALLLLVLGCHGSRRPAAHRTDAVLAPSRRRRRAAAAAVATLAQSPAHWRSVGLAPTFSNQAAQRAGLRGPLPLRAHGVGRALPLANRNPSGCSQLSNASDFTKGRLGWPLVEPSVSLLDCLPHAADRHGDSGPRWRHAGMLRLLQNEWRRRHAGGRVPEPAGDRCPHGPALHSIDTSSCAAVYEVLGGLNTSIPAAKAIHHLRSRRGMPPKQAATLLPCNQRRKLAAPLVTPCHPHRRSCAIAALCCISPAACLPLFLFRVFTGGVHWRHGCTCGAKPERRLMLTVGLIHNTASWGQKCTVCEAAVACRQGSWTTGACGQAVLQAWLEGSASVASRK